MLLIRFNYDFLENPETESSILIKFDKGEEKLSLQKKYTRAAFALEKVELCSGYEIEPTSKKESEKYEYELEFSKGEEVEELFVHRSMGMGKFICGEAVNLFIDGEPIGKLERIEEEERRGWLMEQKLPTEEPGEYKAKAELKDKNGKIVEIILWVTVEDN